jgi:hypothetical protein
MKTMFLFLLLSFSLSVCAQDAGCATNPPKERTLKIKITTHEGATLTATLVDNVTTRALVAKLPLTISLTDLYAREMCYRFPEALPVENVQTAGYEIGEIIYWPPRHSFVIMYAQNGEQFSMQKLGCIDSGVDIFRRTGDMTVTLETIQ